MAAYRRVDDLITVTCRMTACTPGSAPGPTLGVEYGKPLPLLFFWSQTGPRLVADLLARASSLLASQIVRDRPNSSSLKICDKVCDQDSVMEFGLDQLRTDLRHAGSSYLDMSR